MNSAWMTLSETVLVELSQCRDEGRDVDKFENEAAGIEESFGKGQVRERDAKDLIDRMRSAPVRGDYPYREPDELAEIKQARPGNANRAPVRVNPDELYDKIYGAWLGRCAGCLLGQPIEGWRRARITGLLKDTDNYPVTRFISSAIPESVRGRYNVSDTRADGVSKVHWVNNVRCAPSDDDTNYTVLYYRIFEKYGRDFTGLDIAESWLRLMPMLITCTAERVAYKNMANLVLPPLSGSYYNAYREWIGAQIRADFFGYVNPGNPERAAEYAWRDGRVSHVRNGIYGEMFTAAMIARAAASRDMADIVKTGLAEIPAESRLAEGVGQVLRWRGQNLGWEAAVDKLHSIWNEKDKHHWCHVISNAMICAVALLWGENDFSKTVGISICAGFDTDCNAATTGSIVGMAGGTAGLSAAWTGPLGGRLVSGIAGMAETDISQLAAATTEIAKQELR